MGAAHADDAGYGALLKAVADAEDLGAARESHPRLADMLKLGDSGIAFDLEFPEVFHPGGAAQRGGGFDAIIGNPPWDTVRPLAKEFFAAFDLNVLDAPTRRERTAVEDRLLADPLVRKLYDDYLADIDGAKRGFDRLTDAVGKQAEGRSSGAVADLWQVFAERSVRVLRDRGRVGLILPSAFHANQSATGIRELYLDELALERCFSFENRELLFSIHRSFKFAAVVAQRSASGTQEFECAFYLHHLDWLFGERDPLVYTRRFVEQTGGGYLTFLELRSPEDAVVAARLYQRAVLAGEVMDRANIRCGEEIHMTKGSDRFTSAGDIITDGVDPREPEAASSLRERGYLVLYEGKTFHQFDDRWGDVPRYLVAVGDIADRPLWGERQCYYRMAFRDIASSTNERTGIFCLLPPGILCGNTSTVERGPAFRTNKAVLLFLALANSYPFDWALRLKATTHVNSFVLSGCPMPALQADQEAQLAHAALRLTCNHAGYAPLWHEQLGDAWREPTPRHTWPVLADDDARWAVRAAIDAVVAQAYGLDRDQYTHVLSSFSHKSYPKAPELCLAAFDELHKIGLEAFTRKHDPYHDIALVETLAKPVIDLPGAEISEGADGTTRQIEASGQVQLLGPDNGPLFGGNK